ncbi:T9SS type A sorting domain-containing protein [Runella salmonicolor]|uniref:T9SS type A sorting domain-containing protein n=1 Tax=Runella salmonicolor TaxID=2950278 RepID=A0ABT1FNK7_9BACT|nr:T9SS type A sorting domain-containing protein [Runella salmonicolor]MCP1383350.1 T9SS type A sorting domain-containing protein [Runella salmonicolor]
MKTKFALIALVAGLGVATTALSQEEKKEARDSAKDKVTVRVRMSEEKDGKTEIVERSYTYNNLSEAEREAKVKAIVDSLKGTGKDATNRRLSIEIEEGDSRHPDHDGRYDDDRIVRKQKEEKERVKIYKSNPKDRQDNYNYNHNFRFDFDEEAFADRMKRVEKRIEPQMRKLERNMEDWSRDFEPKFREFWHSDINLGGSGKPASIRGLEAFPNNPDKNELNLRFYAPNKGDVTITVTDTKGKQVSRKEVKDFSGDYVGQLELGKNAKGTYFVNVVQNEDGAVKRIVIE